MGKSSAHDVIHTLVEFRRTMTIEQIEQDYQEECQQIERDLEVSSTHISRLSLFVRLILINAGPSLTNILLTHMPLLCRCWYS